MRSRDGSTPICAQRREDRREPLLPHLGAEAARVEPHVLGAGLAHAAHDRLRDDVARREVGERVLALHERARPRRRAAPRPRRAPPRSPAAAGPSASAPSHSTVGWNCTNSRSATAAPARSASAMPSPVATDGFVDRLNTWPRPPVASTTAGREHRADAVALALAHDVQRQALRGAAVVERAGRARARSRSARCRPCPRPRRRARARSPHPWRRRPRARCGRAGGRPRG